MTTSEKNHSEPGQSSATMKSYVIANAIFWAFLALLFIVAKIFIGDTSGMMFVLGTLGVAFTAVSIGDWFFERRESSSWK